MKHEKSQFEHIDYTVTEIEKGNDPYPLIVEIQPSDKCQYFCSYCFHKGLGRAPYGNEEGLFYGYERLFDEMKELGINNLSISEGGEPFFNHRTSEIVKEAHRRNLTIRMVSNGRSVEEPDIQTLLLCDEVRFSVDAAYPHTYATIKRCSTDDFQYVISNIEKFVQKKTAMQSSTLIATTFIVTNDNHAEAVDYLELATSLGVDRIIYKPNIYGNSTEVCAMLQCLDSIYHARRQIEVRKCMDILPAGNPCYIPYFKVAVDPFGIMHSCCLGSQPRDENGYRLGSLKDASLKDIWDASAAIRRSMRIAGVNCRKCNYTDYLINKRIEERKGMRVGSNRGKGKA